jgi:hypothetical protein
MRSDDTQNRLFLTPKCKVRVSRLANASKIGRAHCDETLITSISIGTSRKPISLGREEIDQPAFWQR